MTLSKDEYRKRVSVWNLYLDKIDNAIKNCKDEADLIKFESGEPYQNFERDFNKWTDKSKFYKAAKDNLESEFLNVVIIFNDLEELKLTLDYLELVYEFSSFRDKSMQDLVSCYSSNINLKPVINIRFFKVKNKLVAKIDYSDGVIYKVLDSRYQED